LPDPWHRLQAPLVIAPLMARTAPPCRRRREEAEPKLTDALV